MVKSKTAFGEPSLDGHAFAFFRCRRLGVNISVKTLPLAVSGGRMPIRAARVGVISSSEAVVSWIHHRK
ncbi:hypothetical protein DESC_590172 [Desulfosarcina cetonica]|nr:hypothetical protein DESC_590172 [Desulfosarcina cetonica]